MRHERHVMTGHSSRLSNVAVLLALVWLAVAAQLLFQNWTSTALTLGDSDDAMRLVELRAFLGGRGWYDLHEFRVAAPGGLDTHWSRLIDGGLAALFMAFRLFADPAWAERLTRVVWPLLWLVPAMTGAVAIAWRIAGRHAALAALLLLAFGLPAFQQFKPGRVDHHDVQITLALLVLAASVWSDRAAWTAWAAGALSGLALAIGFESAPFAIVAGGLFVLRYTFDRNAAGALAAYGLAAAAATVAVFLASVSPALWWQPECDALAINSVAAVTAAGLAAAAVARWFPGASPASRFGAVAIVAVAAALLALSFDPRCVGGPFALIDPQVWPVWHSHVREMKSLPTIAREFPTAAFAIAAYPVVALIAAVALALDPEPRRNPGFLGTAAALAVAVALTAAAIRSAPYALWLGVPIVAAAALRLNTRLKLKSLPVRALVVVLLSPVVISAGAIVLAEATGQPPVAERSNAACFDSASYRPLAALPAGTVAADVDYGPYVLALTHHSVLAAPYHRLSSAIVANHRIFASPPDKARELLKGAGVSYVVICGNRPPEELSETQRRASLWGRLDAGDVPVWLEPVPKSGPLTIYRVR